MYHAQKLTNWIQFRIAERAPSQEKQPVNWAKETLLYQTIRIDLKKAQKVCEERKKKATNTATLKRTLNKQFILYVLDYSVGKTAKTKTANKSQ